MSDDEMRDTVDMEGAPAVDMEGAPAADMEGAPAEEDVVVDLEISEALEKRKALREANAKKLITFICNDGETITTTLDAVRSCRTIMRLVEDIGEISEDSIPLDLDIKIFTTILEFQEKFPEMDKEKTPEEMEKFKEDPLSPEEEEFLKVSLEFLYSLTLGANFMDNVPLGQLCCKGIAELIKGKTTSEIEIIFNGNPSDFTEEEKAEAFEQEPWLKALAEDAGLC